MDRDLKKKDYFESLLDVEVLSCNGLKYISDMAWHEICIKVAKSKRFQELRFQKLVMHIQNLLFDVMKIHRK